MGIINSMRRQNAVYWPPTGADGYGRQTYGAPVSLALVGGVNYRVRWQDVVEEFIDATGDKTISKAKVFVPQLPGDSEVEVGGYLWLGDYADLASTINPTANAGAAPVRRFDRMPTLKATEFLRTAYV